MTASEIDNEWPGRAWRGRLDIDQSLLTQTLSRSNLNVIRHARRTAEAGWSDPSSVADGFVVTPCLRPTRLAEVQFGGRTVASSVLVPRGGLLLYSLKESYQVHIPDPFDAVSFRIDQATLDDSARQVGMSSAPELSETFQSRPDEIMLNLSLSLLPALHRPSEVNKLFADHVLNAVLIHLLAEASKPGAIAGASRRMTAANVRAAHDYMLAYLSHDTSSASLAALCDLSVDQFNRAFKMATGLPPHRWLLRERVRRARELLEGTNLSIGDIAAQCGFADQSHLTRVFKGHVGVSPGAWRRDRGL